MCRGGYLDRVGEADSITCHLHKNLDFFMGLSHTTGNGGFLMMSYNPNFHISACFFLFFQIFVMLFPNFIQESSRMMKFGRFAESERKIELVMS